MVFGASRVSSSVYTTVTRGNNDGDTTKTNLLVFSVYSLYVLLRIYSQLLAFSSTNSVFALLSFVPSVGDRYNVRGRGLSEDVSGKSVLPYIVSLNPEPVGDSQSSCSDVLDVQSGFDLRSIWVVASNNVIRGDCWDRDSHFRSEGLELRGAEELVLEFDYTSTGVSSVDRFSRSTIHFVDGLRNNNSKSFRFDGFLYSSKVHWEVGKSKNKIDGGVNFFREGERTPLFDDLLARLVMLENKKSGAEHLLKRTNSGKNVNGINTFSSEGHNTRVSQPLDNGSSVLRGRCDDGLDFFDGKKLSVERISRCGHIPKTLLQNIKILLFKGNGELYFSIGISTFK
mmetsp:Transcript_184/g.211  ORF Transcript_184/g.211 Transcript_184/m.211 type:complete len:341 (-) Transcript_184:99-1121(-)